MKTTENCQKLSKNLLVFPVVSHKESPRKRGPLSHVIDHCVLLYVRPHNNKHVLKIYTNRAFRRADMYYKKDCLKGMEIILKNVSPYAPEYCKCEPNA